MNKGRIAISFGVDRGENFVGLLPAILLGQPTGAFWQEKDHEKEKSRGNHLQAPWGSPSGGSLDEAAAIGHVKHDQDTPGDRPLLRAYHLATLAGLGQFGDVYRYLSTENADR